MKFFLKTLTSHGIIYISFGKTTHYKWILVKVPSSEWRHMSVTASPNTGNSTNNKGNIKAPQSRPHFYQTKSAWSKDQGSNENHSPVHNFAPTVTKFCVMWEGQALPQDTKFGNCRNKIVDSRAFLCSSLIFGSSWSGLIKLGPGPWWRGIRRWEVDSLHKWPVMRKAFQRIFLTSWSILSFKRG